MGVPSAIATDQKQVLSSKKARLGTSHVHTSYLSRVPRAVPVEKIWSCGEICPHDRWSGGVILHMTDCHVEKILHMRNVKKICGKCGEIMCTMYGVLSHFTLFCCRITIL